MDVRQQLERGIKHHQDGSLKRAERHYRAVLRQQPKNADALHLLGLLAHARGEHAEAEHLLRSAIAGNGRSALYWRNLATVLNAQNKSGETEAAYREVLRLSPNDFAALNDLGGLYNGQRRLDEAVACYRRAIAIEPASAMAQYNLGNSLYKAGQRTDALRHLHRALELDPDEARSLHMVRALSGETAVSAPLDYVRTLFDDYAENFENDLVERLDYQVPAILRAELDALLTDDRRLGHALDLGCGTGLSGVAFRDRVGRLTGIDLSRRMIEQAAQKGIYDDLACAEAVQYLARGKASFDLIIAADVFIYIGALDELFPAMAARARSGTWLACSIERSEGADVALRPSGRFAHSAVYIEARATAAGFRVERAVDAVIRKGDDGEIDGVLYLMRKR
jgi:predicted TPR repeat methyltransferase